MGDEVYDHIFIGTGPISILEALSQKAQGKSVLLIDRAEQLGGAWGTTLLPNGEDVEIGCHIWSISKPVFRFIDSYLDVDMAPLKPQPVIYRNGKNLLYDWKSNVLTLRRMMSNVRRGRIKQLITDWKSPAYRIAILPSRYLYPVQGARTFSKALHDKAREYKLPVILNTKIAEVRNCDDRVELVQSDGSVISSRQVHISSTSSVEKYFTSAKSFVAELNVLQYIHVHLELSDTAGKKISYVRWINDDTIHRISDITTQAESDLERLIIVGIYQDVYEESSEAELLEKILSKLRQNKFIGETTQVSSWKFNVFPTHYIERDQFDPILAAFDGRLSILPSTDLIYGMHYRIKDWNRSLLGSNK